MDQARTRIKFCAMTRVEDAVAAAQLGVDAIGLIFHSQSIRHVSLKQARTIAQALAPFVTTVGVFVDASVAKVQAVLTEVSIDVLQFHGDETAAFCRRFDKPYIKVCKVGQDTDIGADVAQYPDAQAILLDAHHPTEPGGTGQSFDWTRIPKDLNKPIILAGGLNPANVAQAIEQVRPYGVDVVSGIEASKGIKDPAKMQAFVQQVTASNRVPD